MTPRRALGYLIATSTVARLVAAASLGLGNDEAYHLLYALHPAPSYYDHPPMVAWVEMLGMLGLGNSVSNLALRSGFVVLFAGSTWLMWRIASRWFGDWAGFYAALALNLTGYYGLAASTFALPDGPLLFFWLLTIDRASLALDRPARLGPWITLGLAWGCAMLSKYHAVFLPVGTALYLLLRPERRRWLLAPGPYLAIGVGLLVFSPVLIWNAAHEWVSFAFQGGRAVGGSTLRLDYLAGALGAQAAYLFPWFWVPLVWIGFRSVRGWRDLETEDERLAVCLCAAPLATFTAVACFQPVLPHWGLIGLVSLFPMLGRSMARRAVERPSRSRRRLLLAGAFPLILLAVALGQFHTGWLQRGDDGGFGFLTETTDPTAEMYGWDQVAARLDELGLLDDPSVFLFTRNWFLSAQLARATELRRPVLCYNLDDPRGFAFWSDPQQWIGRDGVLVMVNEDYTPFNSYLRWFESCEALDDFRVERAGKLIRRVRVFRLNNQLAALPYQYTREQAETREAIREKARDERWSPPPEVGSTATNSQAGGS